MDPRTERRIEEVAVSEDARSELDDTSDEEAETGADRSFHVPDDQDEVKRSMTLRDS